MNSSKPSMYIFQVSDELEDKNFVFYDHNKKRLNKHSKPDGIADTIHCSITVMRVFECVPGSFR